MSSAPSEFIEVNNVSTPCNSVLRCPVSRNDLVGDHIFTLVIKDVEGQMAFDLNSSIQAKKVIM